jgi:hypothetical protein
MTADIHLLDIPSLDDMTLQQAQAWWRASLEELCIEWADQPEVLSSLLAPDDDIEVSPGRTTMDIDTKDQDPLKGPFQLRLPFSDRELREMLLEAMNGPGTYDLLRVLAQLYRERARALRETGLTAHEAEGWAALAEALQPALRAALALLPR